jgi:threonyl-tRNA synthetase
VIPFLKKIRNGEIEKIPYLFIVWEKEESENTISWRSYKTKEQGTCTLEEFVQLQACLPAKAGL